MNNYVPLKAVSYLKQYLPLKPHKWGYKLFVLCGVSGYGYNFEIYTGNENKESQRLANEPDFETIGNVVIRMSRKRPNNAHHKLFFNNYYTSITCYGIPRKKRNPYRGNFQTKSISKYFIDG
jgi:hypothetical protein